MVCFHPLHAFKAKPKEPNKISITFRPSESWKGERLDLPCGQCIGCRRERTRQWAVRCMHEASLYSENSFVTLTYDDAHLPKKKEICSRCVNPHIIEGSVCVADFQDFMKRLRKSEPKKGIRFLHCGEYGELKKRPHYHALLFNHGFADRRLFSKRNGIGLFTSARLQELWPLGFSTIGDVNFETASYVAGYALKKVTGDPAKAFYGQRRPDYITMSRRPGIGQGWFEKFKTDVYPCDRVIVRGHPSRPPRYYDTLFGMESPDVLRDLKKIRENNGNRFVDDVLSDGRVVKVSDSSCSRLVVKEVCSQAQLDQKKRSLED